MKTRNAGKPVKRKQPWPDDCDAEASEVLTSMAGTESAPTKLPKAAKKAVKPKSSSQARPSKSLADEKSQVEKSGQLSGDQASLSQRASSVSELKAVHQMDLRRTV